MNISDLGDEPSPTIRGARGAMLTPLSFFTDRLWIRGLLASSCFVFGLVCFAPANAAETNPVDVRIPEAPPPRRVFAIEYNPIALVIERISVDIEVAPAEHHAVV